MRGSGCGVNEESECDTLSLCSPSESSSSSSGAAAAAAPASRLDRALFDSPGSARIHTVFMCVWPRARARVCVCIGERGKRWASGPPVVGAVWRRHASSVVGCVCLSAHWVLSVSVARSRSSAHTLMRVRRTGQAPFLTRAAPAAPRPPPSIVGEIVTVWGTFFEFESLKFKTFNMRFHQSPCCCWNVNDSLKRQAQKVFAWA